MNNLAKAFSDAGAFGKQQTCIMQEQRQIQDISEVWARERMDGSHFLYLKYAHASTHTHKTDFLNKIISLSMYLFINIICMHVRDGLPLSLGGPGLPKDPPLCRTVKSA